MGALHIPEEVEARNFLAEVHRSTIAAVEDSHAVGLAQESQTCYLSMLVC